MSEMPYEEFKCPVCRDTIVVGDLAVIDHYLKHRKSVRAGEIEIRNLEEYRALSEKNKRAIYYVARKFFAPERRGQKHEREL